MPEGTRFVVVTGKGGVGKTTFSAAQAVALADAGKRVLVCMCNAKERLSTMLGAAPIGPEIASVGERIWAVNIQPERALTEYGQIVLHSRALSKTLFDNRYARAFLRGVPGMQEWAMLGKAWWHTTELLPGGAARYDVVILDAPATGHGIDMLRVPKVIMDVMPPGILRRDAERAWDLFRDAKTCAIVLVTIPEEMPTTETLELARDLQLIGLRPGRVVVNGVMPALFSADERAELDRLSGEAPRDRAAEALALARDRAVHERAQAASVARLSRDVGVPLSVLPFVFEDAASLASIRTLAARITTSS